MQITKERLRRGLMLIMAMTLCIGCMTVSYASSQQGRIEEIIRNADGTRKAVDIDGRSVIKQKYTGISPIYTPAGEYYTLAYKPSKTATLRQGIVDAYGKTVMPLKEGGIKWTFFDDEVVNYYVDMSTKAYSFSGKDLTPSGYTNSEWVGNGFIIGIKYEEPIQIPPPNGTGPGVIINNTSRDLITPGGKKYPLKEKDNVLEIPHIYGTTAYDDYVMIASPEGTRIIHRTKGVVHNNYAKSFPMDNIGDAPFILAMDENGSFLLMDMDFKQITPEGMIYSSLERTSTGLVLSNSDVTHYYWNDGSRVSESELASFDVGIEPLPATSIFEFSEDPSWTKPVYYPTEAKENIDFSKDYDIQSTIFSISLGGRARADGNQIWLDETSRPAQSKAVVTFEGNNTVRLTFRDYGTAERIFIDYVLNETFDRRVIYPALEMIKDDIAKVGLDPRGDEGYHIIKYETSQLDGLKKTAGFVNLEYKDSEDKFEVLLTYPDDLYTKGIAAYEESLTKVRYPVVNVAKDSMMSYIDQLFNHLHIHTAEYYPVIENYFDKKYNTGIHYSKNHEVLIFNEIFQHYNYGLSDKGGISDVEFEFTDRGLELSIDEYTEESRAFIRYTLEGLFTPEYAKYAYEDIFGTIDYVMTREPATTNTSHLLQTLDRVTSVGPFVIQYGTTITINVAYPIYDYSQLVTPRSHSPNFVNLGYQPDKTMAYVYNYFRPYGMTTGQFSLTKYGVQLTSESISFHSQPGYGPKDPDVRISYNKYDHMIDISMRNQRWLFSPIDAGITEFIEDYFKLTFGEETTKVLMTQIKKDYEAGHVKSHNSTEYQAGGFGFKYGKYGNSGSSIDIRLP